MNINDLKIRNVGSEGVFSEVNTVGEFLDKYGKVYQHKIDEEAFKKQLDLLEKTLIDS